MNKKYEAPQLMVLHFLVEEAITTDTDEVLSHIFDVDTEIENW